MPKHDEVEEVFEPDFERMKKVFANDIKPSDEKCAKARGDLAAAWKVIEDECHLNKRAAKLLFKMKGWSEEEVDDFLRSLYGGMKVLDIGISADLVDNMGDGDAPSMPTKDKKGLGEENLATIVEQRKEDAAAFDNDAKAPATAA